MGGAFSYAAKEVALRSIQGASRFFGIFGALPATYNIVASGISPNRNISGYEKGDFLMALTLVGVGLALGPVAGIVAGLAWATISLTTNWDEKLFFNMFGK